MMFLTLAAVPLLLLMRKPRRGADGAAHAALAN
jgi:hypothetical protein